MNVICYLDLPPDMTLRELYWILPTRYRLKWRHGRISP